MFVAGSRIAEWIDLFICSISRAGRSVMIMKAVSSASSEPERMDFEPFDFGSELGQAVSRASA
jgi:hypothetical protein